MFKFLVEREDEKVVAESGNILGLQLCQSLHRKIVRPSYRIPFIMFKKKIHGASGTSLNI